MAASRSARKRRSIRRTAPARKNPHTTTLDPELDRLEALVGKIEKFRAEARADASSLTSQLLQTAQFEGKRLPVAAECATDVAALRPSRTLETVTARVQVAVARLQGARNLVRQRVETLYGASPPATGGRDQLDKPGPNGDVTALILAVDQLETEISSLFDEIDRLSSL